MAGMKSCAAAKRMIKGAIKIHAGHMEKSGAPSKSSERQEMKYLKGALKNLNSMGKM